MLISVLAVAGGTAGYCCASPCHNCPCGNEVALRETASAADTSRTIGVPARSRFAVSLAVSCYWSAKWRSSPDHELSETPRGKAMVEADMLRDKTPVVTSAADPCSVMTPRAVSWVGRFGRLRALVVRYRCPACKEERRSPVGPARCGTHPFRQIVLPLPVARQGRPPRSVAGPSPARDH
jgi:hypothetical protein